MKLFYVPGVCSLSPHIVLREIGADFQLDKVDRKTKVSESGADYNQLNPKSYVPALQLDDGSVLTEGASILMYLADQKGGEKVAPKAGTKERYKLQEWLVFIATELHKNFSPLFRKTPDPARGGHAAAAAAAVHGAGEGAPRGRRGAEDRGADVRKGPTRGN